MCASRSSFGRITLGVDFSENSKRSLEWVHQQFARDAVIDLVHALELPRIPGFVRDAFPRFGEWVESVKRGARDRLEDAAAGCGSVGESVVVEGRSYTCLVDHASATGSDLVAVGGQGDHRGLGRLVGSTPERLLESSPVPVLVVRGASDHRPKRLLVAIDESAMTDLVIDGARRVVAATGAEVILMTVSSTWFLDSMRRHGGGDQTVLLEQQMAHDAQWLSGAAERCALETADQVVEAGSPDLEILRVADRVSADLIVMGTRGGSQPSPPLVGGCARYVLNNGACPVLFVVGRD